MLKSFCGYMGQRPFVIAVFGCLINTRWRLVAGISVAGMLLEIKFELTIKI